MALVATVLIPFQNEASPFQWTREVKDFLDVLEECDGEVVDALVAERNHGRDGYLRGMKPSKIRTGPVCEALLAPDVVEALSRQLTVDLRQRVGLHEAMLAMLRVLQPEALRDTEKPLRALSQLGEPRRETRG